MSNNNNNNPYELRYDIYQQASQRLSDKFYQDHALWQDFDNWKRDAEASGIKVKSTCVIKTRPEFPAHEDILIEAEKIYEFVKTQ